MSVKQGWSTGKIVAVVSIGVLLLGLICCGVLGLGFKKALDSDGGKMAAGTVRMAMGLQSELGQGVGIDFPEDENDEMGLSIAIPGGIAEDTAAGMQDAIWKHFTKSFADGGPPVQWVSVFSKTGSGGAHRVDVDTLVERTGIPAPPSLDLGGWSDGNSVSVTIGGEEVTVDEVVPDDEDEEEYR